jgi:putative pre-16S rRNA nuclease
MRVLALDHGSARCGCAASDPSGTIATPLDVVERPDSEEGLKRIGQLVVELEAERVVVGLPLTLRGEEGAQAAEARKFAGALAAKLDVPVDLHDERLTTRQAEQSGGSASTDSRAAAHLLDAWLATRREEAAR